MSLLQRQPRAFRMIFMLEIWERFGFYTVQGILTLYFIRFLGFNDHEAYYTFGAFSALVYGMVPIGGYLGDKVLGTKRTIALGLVVLILGYLALSLTTKTHVFFALGLICIGNGLFKANPSSLLAKCYEEHDTRLDSGFTLYYMAINIGSVVALFVGPAVSTHLGYGYAYFISFIGLVIGLVNYWWQYQSVANINWNADTKSISLVQWGLILLGVIFATFIAAYLLQQVFIAQRLVLIMAALVLGVYLFYMHGENRTSRLRMFIALILMLEAIVFFTLYQQMPTSLNLFAVNNVRPVIGGIYFEPQSLQALNPIWIVIMSPILSALYDRLQQKGLVFLVPHKFALGLLCCGVSFSLLYFSRYFHDSQGIVSPCWLVASYFFQSTGELLVSALGVAMVAELVPQKITGFVMGMWFLTSSLAGFLGASVAALTAIPQSVTPGVESLFIYTKVFAYVGLLTLGIGFVTWLGAAPLSRYMRIK